MAKGQKIRRMSGDISTWGKYNYTIQQADLPANTKMLIHFDGNVADAVSLDRQFNTNATEIVSNELKFGSGSLSTGSSHVSFPYSQDFIFGSNDFTIAFWVKRTSSTSGGSVMFRLNTDGNLTYFYAPIGLNFYSTAGVQFVVSKDGTSWADITYKTTGLPADGNWHHVAVVRYGTSLKAYVDGASILSTSISGSLCDGASTGYSVLGDATVSPNTVPANCYIDEFIVVNGTALWTSNFTPPASPYAEERVVIGEQVGTVKSLNPEAYPDGDIQDGYYYEKINSDEPAEERPTNTKVLLHFDDNITDATALHTLVHSGTPSYNEGHFGKAIVFDGVNAPRIPYSQDLVFGTNDFTIAMWAYPTAFTGMNCQLFNQKWYVNSSKNAAGFQISFHATSYILVTFDSDISTGTYYLARFNCGNAITMNTWHHVAVVRQANTFYVFLDGVKITSRYGGDPDTFSGGVYQNPNAPIQIGATNQSTSAGTTPSEVLASGSMIDEVLVVNGTALWTDNFVPPALPYA